MSSPIEETNRAAEAVLIAHQAHGNASCLCGWNELGRSHPGHQVAMLRAAGLLAYLHRGETTARTRIVVFSSDASRRLAEFEAADPGEVEVWRAGFEIGFGRPYTFEITEVTARP